MIKNNNSAPDYHILISVICLIILGIMLVYTSSYPYSYQIEAGKYGGVYFLTRHLFFVFAGAILSLIIYKIDYKKFDSNFFIGLLVITSIVLVIILKATSLGTDFGKGSRRWIRIASFSFMPSDIIKVAAVFCMASYMSKINLRRRNIQNIVVVPIAMILFFTILIYIQKDLGTAVTVAGAMSIMYFIGGAPLIIIPPAIGIAAIGIYLAIFRNKFRRNRLLGYLDPIKNIQDAGWQPAQSLFAYANGGLTGVGIGQSTQKFFYIPEVYNDYILAVCGEELGFLGMICIVALFSVIIIKGYLTAARAKDRYGLMLASGISSLIAIQFWINAAVSVNLVPSKGITLPFISYGGTSLIIYMVLTAILLNISKSANSEVK